MGGGVSVGKVMHANITSSRSNHKDAMSPKKHIPVPEYHGSNWIGAVMKPDESEDNLCDVYENGFSLLMQEK